MRSGARRTDERRARQIVAHTVGPSRAAPPAKSVLDPFGQTADLFECVRMRQS